MSIPIKIHIIKKDMASIFSQTFCYEQRSVYPAADHEKSTVVRWSMATCSEDWGKDHANQYSQYFQFP